MYGLTFEFPLNDGGLGDKFIITSNILSTMEQLKADSIINFYTKSKDESFGDEIDSFGKKRNGLKFKNFYEVIDFFHYKKPSYKIHTNVINEHKDCEDVIDFNLKNKSYEQNNTYIYSKLGKYWPINYDKTIKKTIISFMFYMNGEANKSINVKMFEEFEQLTLQFPNLKFVRLEDLNFVKNVEFLSQSHLLIASEGMWTHLSRAMNVDTIAFTDLKEFIFEFNEQGYFCSENFEECLNKLKEKCIDFKI